MSGLISLALALMLISACSPVTSGKKSGIEISTTPTITQLSDDEKRAKIDAFVERFDTERVDYIFITEEIIKEFDIALEPLVNGKIFLEESRRLTFEPYASTDSNLELRIEIEKNQQDPQDYIQFQCRDIPAVSDFSVLLFMDGRVAGGSFYDDAVFSEAEINPDLLNGQNSFTYTCDGSVVELYLNNERIYMFDNAPIKDGNSSVSFEIQNAGDLTFTVSELILNRISY